MPLSTLLTNPDHSLIDQSRHARQNVETTNGDGFGVGWYGEEPTPGVYRDTHPAWNDTNYRPKRRGKATKRPVHLHQPL